MLGLKTLTTTSALGAALLMSGCADLGQIGAGEPNGAIPAALLGNITDLEVPKPQPGMAAATPGSSVACVGVEPSKDHLQDCYWKLKNLIDNDYRRYKITLFHAVGSGNLFADTLSEGLNVAGVITPGATAAKLFGALAGGVTAEKGFVNADILYKQTISIILSEMDTDRADVATANKSDIINLGKGDLSWGQALNDLLAYYEAGTFQHALVTLESKAGNSSTSDNAQAQAMADAINQTVQNAQPAAGDTKPLRPTATRGSQPPRMVVVPTTVRKNSGDRRNFTAGGQPIDN